MPAPKLHRFIDLIAFLAGRHVPVPVEAIMEGVPSYAARWMEADERGRSSVRRMFERDKEELRELGIPIDMGPLPAGSDGEGYRIVRRDFYLPYLRLLEDAVGAGGEALEPSTSEGAGEEGYGRGTSASSSRGSSARPPAGAPSTFEIEAEEAGAAIEGLLHLSGLPDFPLAAEARSAWRKLTFDLDPARFRPAPVVVLPAGAPVGEAIGVLTDALLARRKVAFDYHAMRTGERSRREVAPWGLLLERGQWYLAGHDALRDALRVFRLSRMSEVAPAGSGRGPDFEVPDDFDLAALSGRKAWELDWSETGAPVEARVRFGPSRARWAERNGYGEPVNPDARSVAAKAGSAGSAGSIGSAKEGAAGERVFPVLDPPPFLGWILSLDGEAELLAPGELREGVRKAAARVAGLHDSAPRAHDGKAPGRGGES